MSVRDEAANQARATQRQDQEDEGGLLDTVGHTFGSIARDRAEAPESPEDLERERLANDQQQRQATPGAGPPD